MQEPLLPASQEDAGKSQSVPFPATSDSKKKTFQAAAAQSQSASLPATSDSKKKTFQADVEGLPDLTEKLKEHGLHEEYVQFRDGYMKWRKGEAAGAKGELDHVQERSKDFAYWYPSVGTFNFRRTIAFWGGTLTIEGCLLFLWVAYIQEYGRAYQDLMYYMTKWPTLCGGTAFLAAVYLPYYEIINLKVDLEADKRNFVWCSWRPLFDEGVEIWSILGSALYVVGALLYTVAQISDLFTLTERQDINMVQWPLTVGGFLFFVAGACELLINRVFVKLPVTYVWWASVFDTIGGVGFWLSGCPSIADSDTLALIGAVGTAGYFFGAIMILAMWRGEQYGTAILPLLNSATRTGLPNIVVKKDKDGICHIVVTPSTQSKHETDNLEDVLSPRMTWKGIFFLTIYVLIGVIQMVVLCTLLSQSSKLWRGGIHSRKVLCNLVSDACNVIMVHMILMLQSACVKMPRKNEQPYRGLFVGVRVLAVVLAANSLLSLEVIFEADVQPQR